MRILLLASLAIAAEAQAQVGCFVEFSNPNTCSIANFGISTDYATNQSSFGTATANMIEQGLVFWDQCEAEKATITTNGVDCLVALDDLQDFHTGYVTGCELRKNADGLLIKKLKRRVRKLKRARR